MKIFTKIKEILKKSEKKHFDYVSTAPICDEEMYGTYSDILHHQVKSKDVYNVGVIAPYGAGKSSLLKTYKDTKCNFITKKRITTISLANFNAQCDGDGGNQDFEKPVQDIECSVEKSILEQFIFKVGKSKLPHSRIDRINHKHGILSLILSLVITATIALICCGVLECLNILPFSSGNNFYYYFGFAAGCVVALLTLLFYGNRLKKISIKEVELDICANSNVSVLNIFIDELIYFFRKTKINVVIIEDLDRFNNLNLFSKLRELNFLINNSTAVKQKVTFVYAVKDDLFKTENDRAKFFDYIISLVPVLSFTNARNLLNKEIEKLPEEMRLPESFIYEVAHFISEMRILKNVMNDYLTYYEILNIKKLPSKNKNIKLFSLVLYKNLRPSDFAELQFGKGQLADYFESKNTILKEDIEICRKKLLDLENRRKRAEEAKLNSIKAFKSLIKGLIIDFNQSRRSGINYVDIESIRDFTNPPQGISYSNYYSYSCTTSYLEELLGDSLANFQNRIRDKEEANKKQIEQEIDECREQIRILTNYSLQEFLQANENFIKDDIHNFLLANGFIAEDYKDYIAHIDQELLSTHDAEFVRAVLSKRTIEYAFKLDDPLKVIREIRLERFSDKYVLNYDLVKKILSYGDRDDGYLSKRDSLIKYLLSRDKNALKFILSYINDGQDIDLLIETLLPQSKFFSYDILSSNDLSDVNKKLYVKQLFEICKIDDIISQNHNNILTEFLNNYCEIIDEIGSISNELFLLAVSQLNLKIKHLKCSEENYDIARKIINESNFEININNLGFILYSIKQLDCEKFKDMILTPILATEDEGLIIYISSNIAEFINLYKSENGYRETQCAFEFVLNQVTLSTDCRKKFIEVQANLYDIYDGIEQEIAQYLFVSDKIAIKWDNIVKAIKKKLITITEVIPYLNRHAEELGNAELDDKDIILLLCNNIDSNNLTEFTKFSKGFRIELLPGEIGKDEVCEILILNGNVLSDENNLNAIYTKPHLISQMLKVNQYLVKYLSSSKFTNNVLEQVILSAGISVAVLAEILKITNYLPSTQQAVEKIKEVLIYAPIGSCRKNILEKILSCEGISIEDKLKVISNNDLSLSKSEYVDLLELLEPNIRKIKTEAEPKLNLDEISVPLLLLLEEKKLFKVRQLKYNIKFKKLF